HIGRLLGLCAVFMTLNLAADPAHALPLSGALVSQPTSSADVYVQISAGATHTLALRSDGSVEAWGSNYSGESDVPALPAGLSFVEVSAGGNIYTGGFSVARLSDGSAVAWGASWDGQLNVPALPSGLSYVEVEAGLAHGLARRSDGTVVGWGSNMCGECDIPVLPAGVSYVELAASGNVYNDPTPLWPSLYINGYSLARRSDGSVVVWGCGFSAPVLPTGISYVGISAVPYGWSAVRSDGEIFPAWPALAPGLSYVDVQSGAALVSDGSIVQPFATPGTVPALPPGTSYVDLSAGGHRYVSLCHACNFPPYFIDTTHYVARRSDGIVVAWGDNESGQCAAPGNAGAMQHGTTAVNSTQASAVIRAFGSNSLAANELKLEALSVPNTAFLFLRGTQSAQMPFGNGSLCLGGDIVRIQLAGHASDNIARVTLDLPSIGVNAPGVNYFQCWFRDPAAGGAEFNTSDALYITFVP
ncbi:MAG: hypothetical protein ACI9K5_003964, partial [Gammaproteobacteria bacterium]